MDYDGDDFVVKLEPEVVICNNDDDVEIAFDPFGSDFVDFDVKQEVLDVDNENIKQEAIKEDKVNIVELFEPAVQQKTPAKWDSSDDDDFFANDFHNDSDDDPEYQLSSTKSQKPELDIKEKDCEASEAEIDKEKTNTDKIDSKLNKKAGKKKKLTKDDLICRECGKAFKYLSLLKIHQRSHLESKGHDCPLCRKSFARFDHCKTHLNTVHCGEVVNGKVITPANQQKCEICGRVFNHAGNFKTHMKIHAGERYQYENIIEKH